MMQSSFLVTCILLALFQATFASSKEELGYNCDDKFIPMSRLIKVANEAKENPTLLYSIGESYKGPPFRKAYLLWPVYSWTGQNSKDTENLYRVVLDDEFQVFSVVMKFSHWFVIECRYNENVLSPNSYKCGNTVYPPDRLGRAASFGCSKIKSIALPMTPIRYDGPVYEGYGKQLYTTPVVTNFDPPNSNDEKAMVVFNVKCAVVGVVIFTSASEIQKCVRLS